MGVSQKSKRITWAPDVNLCQVRLFSSAKPPSEIGMGTRDHRLQAMAKASWLVHQDDSESLPPGFEVFKPANLNFHQIPMTKWRCPPRYQVNSEWQVVSGEESKEIEFQKQRERRVLEEIYPRPSAIPPNPRAPVNAQESTVRDQNIPLIPLTPIEEAKAGVASALPQAQPADMIPQPQHGPDSSNIAQTSMHPDTVAAALASVLSNIPNYDHRNLIVQNLLLRVLTNPKMVEQLLAHKVSSTQHIPNLESQPKIYSESTRTSISREASLSAQNMKPQVQVNSAPMTTAAPPQLPTGFVSTSRPAVDDKSSAQSPSIVKDLSYYKSLIQQHGVVGGPQSCGQSNQMMGASQEYTKSRDEMRPKIMKPCIYFNSSKGCKFGAKCNYIHGTFSSRKRAGCVTEVVAAKRVKLGSSVAL